MFNSSRPESVVMTGGIFAAFAIATFVTFFTRVSGESPRRAFATSPPETPTFSLCRHLPQRRRDPPHPLSGVAVPHEEVRRGPPLRSHQRWRGHGRLRQRAEVLRPARINPPGRRAGM
jgi:hypothetical protein